MLIRLMRTPCALAQGVEGNPIWELAQEHLGTAVTHVSLQGPSLLGHHQWLLHPANIVSLPLAFRLATYSPLLASWEFMG